MPGKNPTTKTGLKRPTRSPHEILRSRERDLPEAAPRHGGHALSRASKTRVLLPTDLHTALANAVDVRPMMQRVLAASLALIGQADGAALELDDGKGHMVYACATGSLGPFEGLAIPRSGSLSGLTVESGITQKCDDTEHDPRVDHEACLRVGAKSMICVPLHREGRVRGALKVSSSRPHEFTQSDVQVLTSLSEFLGTAVSGSADLVKATGQLLGNLGSGGRSRTGERALQVETFIADVVRPGMADGVAARQRIERAIRRGAVHVVGQPIVNIQTGQVVGVEALARFPKRPYRTPDLWFAEAHAVGLGVDLELLAIRSALSVLDRLPTQMYLAVNAGPLTICDERLTSLLVATQPDRIVLELTEHTAVGDYAPLLSSLTRLRRAGVRLAVDDTGSGISSLAHVLRLAPDVVKLDRALTMGIDQDPARRSLGAALVSFAGDIQAKVVAEGVETPSELDTLRRLGITLVQGYYLARPAPVQLLQCLLRTPPRWGPMLLQGNHLSGPAGLSAI